MKSCHRFTAQKKDGYPGSPWTIAELGSTCVNVAAGASMTATYRTRKDAESAIAAWEAAHPERPGDHAWIPYTSAALLHQALAGNPSRLALAYEYESMQNAAGQHRRNGDTRAAAAYSNAAAMLRERSCL